MDYASLVGLPKKKGVIDVVGCSPPCALLLLPVDPLFTDANPPVSKAQFTKLSVSDGFTSK